MRSGALPDHIDVLEKAESRQAVFHEPHSQAHILRTVSADANNPRTDRFSLKAINHNSDDPSISVLHQSDNPSINVVERPAAAAMTGAPRSDNASIDIVQLETNDTNSIDRAPSIRNPSLDFHMRSWFSG